MTTLGKLIGMAAIGKFMVGKTLYQRIIPKIVALIMLTIITTVLAVFLVAASCYASYVALQHYGMASDSAVYLIAFCIMASVLLSSYVIRRHVRKLYQALQPLSPVTEFICDIANEFADGFNKHRHPII